VLSVAKMQSLLMGVIGLILGVIYGLIFIFLGAAATAIGTRSDGPNIGGVPSIVLGIVFMIAVPIFYAILGFIVGCIWALVYNIAAGVVGGIKFDLESVGPQYAAPPAPHQWAPQ
jgi:Na+(H+)/acetate symporter ActP